MIFKGIFLTNIIIALSFFFLIKEKKVETVCGSCTPTIIQVNEPTPSPSPSVQKEEVLIQDIIIDVPFTAQAPFAQWSDPRQEDGCEEAASLMAVRFAKGQTLTKEEALQIILSISEYESENFNEYRDTSAFDTAERIIKGYFGYEKAVVKDITRLEEIITELVRGRVVILPMNGRALGNPYFTPPGPERHMLLVRGYDTTTHEFITNDPGIRQGEGYRYPENVLFEAIRDYSTGYHVPIERIEKVMIVVEKS